MSNEEVIDMLNNLASEMADKVHRLKNTDTINGLLGGIAIVHNKIIELGGEIKEIK